MQLAYPRPHIKEQVEPETSLDRPFSSVGAQLSLFFFFLSLPPCLSLCLLQLWTPQIRVGVRSVFYFSWPTRMAPTVDFSPKGSRAVPCSSQRSVLWGVICPHLDSRRRPTMEEKGIAAQLLRPRRRRAPVHTPGPPHPLVTRPYGRIPQVFLPQGTKSGL